METMTFKGTLAVTECWCGMTYAIPKTLHDYVSRQHRDGVKQQSIYCPLGHSWSFSGEGEADKLRKQLDKAQRAIANREEDLRAERASHIATKGALTKAKNRAARGVCPAPDCHRSVNNLAEHVATCHPELLAES